MGVAVPPSAPWEEQGWVPGVLLWFPWLGSSFGTALSHQCQVSSWLGVSSLSRGQRCQHLLHKGTTTQTPPGQQGKDASPAPALAQGMGVPLAPLSCLQPQQGRIPVFPESSHLPLAPQREPGAARSLLPAQWLLSGPAAATKGPLWARGSRGQSAGVLPAGPLPAPRPAGVCPCPPPGGLDGEGGIPGNGIWGGGERARRGRERAWTCRAGSGELCPGAGTPPGMGSAAFPPPVHLGATAGRKMRLQGRGHAGWDVDFHLEMPSGLLTLGGYHKATGNPQGRGRGWVFQEIHVSPLPVTPLQSCTLSRGAAGSPCSRLLDLDKKTCLDFCRGAV